MENQELQIREFTENEKERLKCVCDFCDKQADFLWNFKFKEGSQENMRMCAEHNERLKSLVKG